MMNNACDFIQSKMKKYFEWIILTIIVLLPLCCLLTIARKSKGVWYSEQVKSRMHSIMISMKKNLDFLVAQAQK